MSIRSSLKRAVPDDAAGARTRLRPSLALIGWVIVVPLALIALGVWEGDRAARDVETGAQARTELPRTLERLKALAAQNPRAGVRLQGAPTAYAAILAVTKVEEAITALDRDLLVSEVRRRLAWGTVAGASLALGAGLLGLVLAGVAGRHARGSRDRLVAAFSLVRRALPFGLGGQVTGLALAVLCAVLFEVGGLWFTDRFSSGEFKLALAGLLLGGVAVVAAFAAVRGLLRAFALFTPDPLDVSGRAVGEAEGPGLWHFTRELARRQDALEPDNIVVGLTRGFFVTSAPVRLWPEERPLTGRTLYLAAPYFGLLNGREVAAIVGHELAHFAGGDTAYSQRFAPIYAGLWRALAALQSEGMAAILLTPAATLGFHTVHTFDAAVAHWSRLREFEADRRGATGSGPEAAASALIRTSVADPVISAVLEAAFEAPRDAAEDLVAEVGAAAQRHGLADPRDHLDDRQPHPTDSHPPVHQRIGALQVALDETLLDAATRVAGADERGFAGLLVADWPGLCRALSADFLAGAHRHQAEMRGILEETAAAMPAGETAIFENGRAMVWTMGVVGGVLTAATVATAVFPEPLGLAGEPAFRWGFAACLVLLTAGCAMFAAHVHGRGRAPFLVLTPEGLRSPLLRDAVSWTSLADYRVSADQRLTLTLAILPDAPLPARAGPTLRARVSRRKRELTLTSLGARDLKPEAYAALIGRYLDAARARVLLAQKPAA